MKTAKNPGRSANAPPVMPLDEVGATLRAGAFVSLAHAVATPIAGMTDADSMSLVQDAAKRGIGARADALIRAYLRPEGPAPHEQVLAQVDQLIQATSILAATLDSMRAWIEANPGEILGHPDQGGYRRIFPAPTPATT